MKNIIITYWLTALIILNISIVQAGVKVELRNGKVEEADSVKVEGRYLVLKQKGKTLKISQTQLKDSEVEKYFPVSNKKQPLPPKPTVKPTKNDPKTEEESSVNKDNAQAQKQEAPPYDTNVFTISEESDGLFLKQGIVVESAAYARGLTMDASKCAEILAPISGAKTYRSDGTWKRPEKTENEGTKKSRAELSSGTLSIQQMYYFADRREKVALMEALAKEMPTILSNKNPSESFRRAYEIARSVAPEISIDLAGAAVITSDTKQLAASLAQMADAHAIRGELEKAEFIIGQPEKYKLAVNNNWLKSLKFEIPNGGTAPELMAQFHLSVLLGDAQKAESVLKQMQQASITPEDKKQKTKAAYDKKTLDSCMAKLARVKGDIGSGMSEADQENMKEAMNAVAIAGKSGAGYSERLRDYSTEKLVSMAQQLCDIYGRQSDQMVDMILYLIEERGYSETGLSVDMLLWGAIHAKGRYCKERAIPMFMLAQKVGMEKRGVNHSQQAISDQFAVEAGIYIIQSLDMRNSLMVEMAPVWEKAIWNSVELANKKETHERAKAYNYMASHYLTFLYDSIHESEKLKNAYEYLAKNSQSLQIQAEATLNLSRIMIRQKDYASALKEAEKVATGQMQWRSVSSSIELIQYIAKKTKDVKVWDKSKEYAQKALMQVKDDPKTVETLKQLLQNKHEFT